MKYINQYKEGDRVNGIFLCKQKHSAVTRNGKSYETVILQDKTGSLDGKIWDPGSMGIEEYEALDYIDIGADVTEFNGQLQFNIKRLRVAGEGEYDPADYLPVSSKDRGKMYSDLLSIIDSIENAYIKKLLQAFFVEDEQFIKAFKISSAAKSVHHSFVGGLLEHTLSVTRLCEYYCSAYPILKRDLLLSCAILHDIGKVREFSFFPENDYTDEGNLLGHIVMGSEMVSRKAADIDGFPPKLLNEIKHCILSHHGELEFGSPKRPSLIEAFALNLADNTDAKIETFTEVLMQTEETGWLGFNKFLNNNLRPSSIC